ncbi:MAG: hypothetical protein ACPGID_12410 [Rubricella sp.]
MRGLLRKFIADDDGAVTVDFVVLCAVVVGMAAATASLFGAFPLMAQFVADLMSDATD